MKAWTFQDPKQKAKRGAKCPWSVGWYDGRGRKRQKSVGSKTQAKAYARKLEGEAAAGLLRTFDRTSWTDFVARFERDHLSTLAARSQSEYLLSLRMFAKVAKVKYINQVDGSTIAEFRAKRLKSEIEAATVNKDLRHVRCALNRAHKWSLLPDKVSVELLREPERDPEFVDDVAFAKLYAACEAMKRPYGQHYSPAEWWQALLVFAYMTGWRISEILAVRRDDIDWANSTVRLDAGDTKGKRDAQAALHPVAMDHLKAIQGFGGMAFP